MRARAISSLLLLLLATAVKAGTPAAFVCGGREPSWSLSLDGTSARLSMPPASPVTLGGQLREGPGGGLPFFVFRGKADATGELVATVTTEACVDTGAQPSEGDGAAAYTIRLSLSSGDLLRGCCTIAPREPAAPSTPEAAAAPAVPKPAAAPAEPAPSEPPSTPRIGGRITEITLPDGRTCRNAGKGSVAVVESRRLAFDCGLSAGDRIGIFGPLSLGTDGLFAVERVETPWRDTYHAPRKVTRTFARASEIALDEGLVCRAASANAALGFEGRRVSYNCGGKEGETIALLGALEAADRGFRIVRARVAYGETAFTLRSTEPILVTAPE
jgi:hypothetical protein